MDYVEFHVELGGSEGAFHYLVDGTRDQRLFLTEGRTYKFHVNTPGYPFYITSDPFGGPGDYSSTSPDTMKTDKGEILFTPTQKDIGKDLYYQCSTQPKMGYKIWVTASK